MNVWYFSAYDQPRGHSPRTWEYSLELTRLGHSVTMFTNSFCHFTRSDHLDMSEQRRIEMVDGVRVVWVKTRGYKGNGFQRGLNMIENALGIIRASQYLTDRPDVVLGPSVPLLTGWAAERISARFRVPFIFEVRDVWPEVLVDLGGLRKISVLYAVFRQIEKSLYFKAARISSTLPNLSEHVTMSGSDPKKIVTIPNAADLTAYEGYDDYAGGRQDKLVVMYLGGFGLLHDIPTIIEAAKILQDNGDMRFRFILIGDGVRKAECQRLVSDYQLTNLTLRSSVPKVSVPSVLREADILVAAVANSPALRFGLNQNKLCSYFASGRPIVFAGNSPNDPVSESGAGISVAAQDPRAFVTALQAIAETSPQARCRMGEAGRLYARTKLSVQALGKRMEEMLRQSVAKTHP